MAKFEFVDNSKLFTAIHEYHQDTASLQTIQKIVETLHNSDAKQLLQHKVAECFDYLTTSNTEY